MANHPDCSAVPGFQTNPHILLNQAHRHKGRGGLRSSPAKRTDVCQTSVKTHHESKAAIYSRYDFPPDLPIVLQQALLKMAEVGCWSGHEKNIKRQPESGPGSF